MKFVIVVGVLVLMVAGFVVAKGPSPAIAVAWTRVHTNETGKQNKILTTTFGAATDLAWYGERRLPGIICGPGRLAQCHVADEYLDTEQLLLAAKVYAQMLVEWCG